MNYKVMKRPMFRLGGDVRRNYQNGTELEKLIRQRGQLRDKAFQTQRSLLPFQVLAGQMDDIRTIRKPRDVLNILSNIGGSPELMGALAKLPAIDLKRSEGELADKITLEKLKTSRAKGFEFEKRLARADQLRTEQNKLLAGKTPEQQAKIKDSKVFKNLETDIAFLLRGKTKADYLLEASIRQGNLFDEKESSDRYDRIYGNYSEGGRVGYQEGTPEPMMKETISVEETINPVKERPQESTMSVKQMYDLMRQRIPVANVSDKDLYKIASSQQIMADFASLETMSDVTQFNEQYDTNIVLDLPIVG
jgi:hypothetical protein